MDVLIVILGILALIAGFIFSVLPPIPGPIAAYAALLLLLGHSKASDEMSAGLLIWTGLAVVLVMVLDYLTQVWGTKWTGGSKAGVWGTFVGLVAGILFLGAFFGPLAIVIGPFLGAVIFELAAGQDLNRALKSGFGAFLGFVAGIALKIVLCIFITWKFITLLT